MDGARLPLAGPVLSVGQYSDAGRKSENQDFHGACLPEGRVLTLKGAVFAVADGISSSPVAAEAAEAAVKSLLTDYYHTPDTWTAGTAAGKVIEAANQWLHGQSVRAGIDDPDRGHVCTLTALILKGRTGHVLHVGDSRVSLLRGAHLQPLTEDHRVVLSGGRGVLSRALGASHGIKIDHRTQPLALGDLFLLTTDGIHECWDGAVVRKILGETADLDEAARLIAGHVLERGSQDNLTLQIVRVEALPPAGAVDLLDEARLLPPIPLPKPGEMLDGMRVLRALHQGSRSHVFLAEMPDGSRVVVKVPSTETREDPESLRRFLLEDWVARRVGGPFFPRPVDPPVPRGGLYLVTAFVEGQTLRQWMTANARPPLEAVRGLVERMVVALRTLHRQQILHQDLRPENVMIAGDGTIRLIDLGSAAVAGVEEAGPGTLGPLPGTYQYTAPEYLSGDPPGWRSDLFSLGVIAYEMLTGGRLPYGAAVAQVRSRRDQRRLVYRSARDEDTGVPDWIDAALRRATHPDPTRRFEALSEFAAALRGASPARRDRFPRPLAERNPVAFWRAVSGILAVLLLLSVLRQGL